MNTPTPAPTPDASELFQNAAQSGDISPGSAAILGGLSARINRTLSTLSVTPAVTELLQVCMLLDNTPSMEHKNNHLGVIEGHNLVVDALLQAKGVDSVETLSALINPNARYAQRITGDSDLFQWVALSASPRLDKTGFIHGSGTPLYDRCLETLGSVIARTMWWEDNYGVQTRSVTLLMTDGGNNDGRANAADVSKVVKDMLRAEKHKIYFMGVDSIGIDFREIGREMGIPDEYIDVVERDPKTIRAKFQVFSQSAVALAGNAAAVVPRFGVI
jgi:hypothetical protein